MNTIQNVKSFADHKPANPNFLSQSGSTKANWETVAALNLCLAHTIDLRSQTKQALWNAKGPNSYGVQKMLKEFSKQIDTMSDEISKRILTFGGTPVWTIANVAKSSRLLKNEKQPDEGSNSFEDLIDDYDAVAQSLTPVMQQAVKSNDYGSASLITDFARMLDDQCQAIVAHLPVEWNGNAKKVTAY